MLVAIDLVVVCLEVGRLRQEITAMLILGQPEFRMAHLEETMTRKHLSLIAGLITFLAFSGAALAEGSFTSSISGARVGFQSRRWTDRHLDNNDTTIRFDRCSRNNVTIRLWRDISFAPDENRGSKVLNCSVSDTGNWGPVPNSGDYYFQIDAIAGIVDQTVSIDVPFLEVRY